MTNLSPHRVAHGIVYFGNDIVLRSLHFYTEQYTPFGLQIGTGHNIASTQNKLSLINYDNTRQAARVHTRTVCGNCGLEIKGDQQKRGHSDDARAGSTLCRITESNIIDKAKHKRKQ